LLITLSDAAAGGENHDAFRQCVDNYFFNEAMVMRQNDQVAQRLFNKLAAEEMLTNVIISVGKARRSYLSQIS
ncbi:MAG: hypothetical protein ACKN9K_13225, partial [Dolichospermum sp.]